MQENRIQMKQYNKTLFGSIIAFFVGTSCCWLSSLALWVGGVTFIGMVVNFIEDAQILLLGLGIILLITSIFLYLKANRKEPTENKG